MHPDIFYIFTTHVFVIVADGYVQVVIGSTGCKAPWILHRLICILLERGSRKASDKFGQRFRGLQHDLRTHVRQDVCSNSSALRQLPHYCQRGRGSLKGCWRVGYPRRGYVWKCTTTNKYGLRNFSIVLNVVVVKLAGVTGESSISDAVFGSFPIPSQRTRVDVVFLAEHCSSLCVLLVVA